MVSKMKVTKSKEYWKKKLRHVKRLIKDQVYENAALNDYVCSVQEKYESVQSEVQFLMQELEKNYEEDREKDEKPNVSLFLEHGLNNKNETKSVNSKKPSIVPRRRSNSDDSKPSISGKQKKTNPQNQCKRKKITKQIPLDSNGQPVFPIELETFTVHSLGEVLGTTGFNTTDIIFPIGYCSTRLYASIRNPKQETLYLCLIKEVEGKPRFEISADNEPNMPIIGSSPDECHQNLLQRLLLPRFQPRGIDFFGLSHPTVHYLIQCSPNARKCNNYVFTKFEVGKPLTKEESSESKARTTSSDPHEFKLTHKAYLNYLQSLEIRKEIKEEQPTTT